MKQPAPDEYEKIFERLVKYAPVEHQNDPRLKKSTLIFLSLGGEALARQHIETYRKPFPEKLTLFDNPLEEEILKEATSDQSEETEESE